MTTIWENEPLAPRTSFRVEARARRLIEVREAGELEALFRDTVHEDEPWSLLSGGNNILFTHDYDGTLVVPRIRGIRILSEQQDEVLIHVGAGEEWDDVVRWSVEQRLWGIENLSLIPGWAGAAPVQNIGAYGVEVKDTLHEVECFVPATRNCLVLSAAHCAFGYRDSVFKGVLRGRAIITGIVLRCHRQPSPRLGYGALEQEVRARGGPSLANIREAVCTLRRGKLPDPAVLGNAGSFFKNPVVGPEVAAALRKRYPDMPLYPAPDGQVKLAAGWLIDRAGMRGAVRGPAGVHEGQALVLVNRGGATGQQILDLAEEVRSTVRERFGVELLFEVNLL